MVRYSLLPSQNARYRRPQRNGNQNPEKVLKCLPPSKVWWKVHRENPLNEESDVRAEMGRLKDPGKITWDYPTERIVYKWTEMSNSVEDEYTSKTSV